MNLSDSAKRSLRTIYQLLLTLIVAVPAIVVLVPAGSEVAPYVVAFAAAVAGVARLVNALEDRGLIPAWLKGDSAPAVPDAGDVFEEPGNQMAD